jgi:hypothetical protein
MKTKMRYPFHLIKGLKIKVLTSSYAVNDGKLKNFHAIGNKSGKPCQEIVYNFL